MTKLLSTFDVEEKPSEDYTNKYSNLTIAHKFITTLESENHVSSLKNCKVSLEQNYLFNFRSSMFKFIEIKN